MTQTRDPELPGLLLTTERDALVPLLRQLPDDAFAVRTCCPGWTVRHVVAHCSSALMRVVEARFEEGVYSPEANDRDIAERSDWSHQKVVDELERGTTETGPILARTRGRLDVIALGEWIHGGDVREALGRPGAYGGDGLPLALKLASDVSRRRGTVAVHADLDGFDDPVTLGAADGEHPPGRYLGPADTFIRLLGGRPLAGTRYELAGVTEGELNLFRGESARPSPEPSQGRSGVS
ncbi:hypothetical protein DSC45_27625 [Streptomyces sp. YIM 130001]|uniref:maleylpyruvate isomerase family mycothiol-dependent enzyme n=1 Tax=Streptomyces sp. YIM 130001 TaxID=2259644 RepID=UPI000E659FDF|nr:maleylpyruvate isomerase family mycothiol-dependent enzyme [Streptomyces sp. YIM 130001]RII11684.1 hypothetical protein DSC45_27625 [Streptomyces sp. YIM 130001]